MENLQTQKPRTGDEIICCPFRGDQVVFASKHQACRELGITMKRLRRVLDEDLPVTYEGRQYWLDEMATANEDENNEMEAVHELSQ